ncbi:Yqey-like protein-domain-containing protein [Schizophyllum commune]
MNSSLRSLGRFAHVTRVAAVRRAYSTPAGTTDIRAQLMAGIKTAMKAKDTAASTVLRSVQAEVTNADKAANEKVGSSAIISILRKAIQRRTDAAAQYDAAARADLAEQERREAALLAELVPPLLPESTIDEKLREALTALPADTDARAKQGLLFKQFYAIVDKALVDPALVKKRAQAILATA